jgi:hypothetical protein
VRLKRIPTMQDIVNSCQLSIHMDDFFRVFHRRDQAVQLERSHGGSTYHLPVSPIHVKKE